jgi:hypothetical protein
LKLIFPALVSEELGVVSERDIHDKTAVWHVSRKFIGPGSQSEDISWSKPLLAFLICPSASKGSPRPLEVLGPPGLVDPCRIVVDTVGFLRDAPPFVKFRLPPLVNGRTG